MKTSESKENHRSNEKSSLERFFEGLTADEKRLLQAYDKNKSIDTLTRNFDELIAFKDEN